MVDSAAEVSAIMADLGISQANATTTTGPGGQRTFNLTPANASSGPGGGGVASSGPGGQRTFNLTPANSQPSPGGGQTFNLQPANAQPMSFSGPGPSMASSGPGGQRTFNLTPANAPSGGGQTFNLQPANAQPMSFSGPGPSMASSGPGGQRTFNLTPANAQPSPGGGQTFNLTPANAQPMSFSGPGPSMGSSGPGGGQTFNLTPTNASGPGPSFSGPGPSFASSGPGGGQTFNLTPANAQPMSFSGPGPAFASSGPGMMMNGPGGGFSTSGPGANWRPPQQQQQQEEKKPIQMATKTADGREIIHKGPPCANCGEMIIGQCTNALGKTYHPDHFVCAYCSQPFAAGKFMIKDNEPYCETDYFELFGNRCKTCGDPIRDKYITAGDMHFHPDHFVCVTCGKKLAGLKYKVQENEEKDVLCIDCHVKRIEKIQPGDKMCAKCKKPIIGEFITLKGQTMHPEHFRCEECGCAFVGGNCHEFEGALYCLEHYLQLLKKSCAKCNKPILGRGINALGRMWHPEHFGCHVCGEVLNGSAFFEHEGEPYCEQHYSSLFGVTCAKCSKPILSGGKTFLDKHYHEEHFCCSVCDKLLKQGNIREWDSKPYCGECYKKLPSEVRKKYEKKKRQDIDGERKRLKEQKKASKEKEKKAAEKKK